MRRIIFFTAVFVSMTALIGILPAQDSVEVAWIRHYIGPDFPVERAVDLAVDRFGNVYVAIRSSSSERRHDYVVVKYAPDGEQMWAVRYAGPGESVDDIEAIAVDDAGNVYVTGTSEPTGIRGEEHCTTIKYNTDGIQQWVVVEDGSEVPSFHPEDITLDNFENVY